MMWACIRFNVLESGSYVDRWVIVPTYELGMAAAVVDALVEGYKIGSGLPAAFLSIDTVSHEDAVYIHNLGRAIEEARSTALRRI